MARRQTVLTVKAKERLTPRMVRIILGGPGYAHLDPNEHTDSYVKLLLPAPGSGMSPPYDMDALREHSPELLPSKRTYTVRRWNHEAQELWIDMVIHNEPGFTGVASDWADAALPGDVVALMGAGGAYTPRADAEFHLLIGDLATVPAIAAALERMSPEARGVALIQVEHAEDRHLDLAAPEGVQVTWIVGEADALENAVMHLQLEAGVIAERALHVFCHAERELTKRLRRHLVSERGIPREDISISAYWARGRIEDQFQAEKREAIGKID